MEHRRNFLLTMSLAPAAIASGQIKEPDPEIDIFEAARRGDIAHATEFAKWNPAIARLRSRENKTPLHYAVEGGQTPMIFFLTMQGADLSAGPESPLLTAVDYPDPAMAFEMTEALLMNASDVNATRADGRSALELAVARGYQNVAQLLVHRGAAGPLSENIIAERVHFGRRYSFDVDGRPYVAENIDGLPQDFINEFTRLAHFNVDRVKQLMKIAPGLTAARATWDESAIEAAAHMGLVPLARHLADHGAPVSASTAVMLGLRDRVEALVESDALCVHERGAHDFPLLAYAAFGAEQAQIADFLLTSGANVHATAMGGTTPLHFAAQKGYVELGEVLIAHGADVNAITWSREQQATPLALAVKAKRGKMIDFLKSQGAR